MDADTLNNAIVAAIKDSAVPRIDKEKVLQMFGPAQGKVLSAMISELVSRSS
jgi:hypothetical protein